ncbi:hypothetical protein AWENTII_010744 [Aspergillus wentii]|nr:hypothetical protein MW887_009898 [Aspergillus wentii]
MGLWASGMPWGAVGSCIEEKTFSYYPGDKAIRHFESQTGLAWESLEDPPKTLTCLRCKAGIDTPWTTATNVGYDPDVAFAHCTGLADKSFRIQCASCRFSVTHANLRVSQLRRDVQALLKDGTPMPGTILGLRGTPAEKDNRDSSFPNRLIMGSKVELLELTDPANNENTSIESIRSLLERSLKNRRLMCQVNNTMIPTSISHSEGIFIRRMMSSYWDNASPFSLDLTGAVIRQGQFIEKIEQLKWLQSPSLPSTMSSLIAKYGVFTDIMILNQDRAAVPTLDVDLVWHTHQLSPSRYYAFSTQKTNGTLIDHDDKVDEVKISDAFEWTSKQYQKLTGGKVYSECTCWYCEAVRESQNRLSSLTSLSSALSGRSNASVMSNSNINGGNPHISSHNAVRAQGQAAPRASEAKTEELKKNWEKVRRRNEKSAGKKRHSFTQDSGHDVDISSQTSIWGVPCDLPQHGPHMRDPGVHEDIYPSDPLCMNVALGAAGNCVAGTDREAIGAGGCVAGMAMGETPGKHRGGRPGFCQGSGFDGMSGGMF